MNRNLSLYLAVVLGAGCAAQPHRLGSPTAAPTVVHMEPLKLEVVKTPGGPRVEAFDAATLFEQAGADLEAQRYAESVAGYDRLVADFPDSRYVVAALYNGGLASEGKKDFAGAVAHYRRLAAEHGDTRDALDALFRMGACYAELANWAASADAFAQVLSRSGLSVGDRVEAAARRSLAQYNLKDLGAAERTLRDSLAWYRQNESLERLDSDFFLAMSQFYLGEIAHEQFKLAPLRLPQKQLAKDLEAKAQMLLVAQTRYVDTARVKNAAWATASGYQLASLYREFYDALIDAPVPPELKSEARQVYFEELRKQIEPLLRKAIRFHELTQGVAERFGIDNDWVRKSTEQMDQLRALLAQSGAPTPSAAPLPVAAPPPAVPSPSRPDGDDATAPLIEV